MSRDPLPTTDELSNLDTKMLTHIFIEHKDGNASYITKETTEDDLRLTAISLGECRPSAPGVITLPFLLQIYILCTLLMHLLIYRICRKRKEGPRTATPQKDLRIGRRVTLIETGRRRRCTLRILSIPLRCRHRYSTPTLKRSSPPSKVWSPSLHMLTIHYFEEGLVFLTLSVGAHLWLHPR